MGSRNVGNEEVPATEPYQSTLKIRWRRNLLAFIVAKLYCLSVSNDDTFARWLSGQLT